ncbi:hypothetical protein D9M70_640630 [compost metagenome]
MSARASGSEPCAVTDDQSCSDQQRGRGGDGDVGFSNKEGREPGAGDDACEKAQSQLVDPATCQARRRGRKTGNSGDPSV